MELKNILKKHAVMAALLGALITSPCAASMTYQDTVLGQNPLAYYRLNETSGTTAVDLVAGHNATYGSALTLGEAGLQSPEFQGFGADNRALQFDKDSWQSVVTMPTSLGMSSNEGSVTEWFKATPDNLNGMGMLFYGSASPGDGYGDADEMHVHISSEGALKLTFRTSRFPFLVISRSWRVSGRSVLAAG